MKTKYIWMGLGFLGLVVSLWAANVQPRKDAHFARRDVTLFPEGKFQYHLAMTSQGSLNVAGVMQTQGASQGLQANPPKAVSMALDGILEVDAAENTLILRLKDIKISSGSQIFDPVDLGFRGKPIKVTTDPHGAFVNVSISKDESAVSSTVWLNVLSQIQLVYGPDKRVSAWDMEEGDFQTRFLAHYESQADTLSKVKTRLLDTQLTSAAKLEDIHFIPGEAWLATFSADRLESLQSKSGLVFTGASAGLYQSFITLNLNAAKERTNAIAGSSFDASYAKLAFNRAILDELTMAATEASRYASDMDAITPDQIFAAVAKGLSEGEETELYKKIRAYLYKHPDECKTFESVLIESDPDGVWLRLAGMAMGRLGHTQAQASLRRVIDARLKQNKSVSPLIQLLAQSREPTPETLDLLQTFALSQDKELQEAGMLASGTALSGHRIQDPVDASRRLRLFQDKFRASKDEREADLILDLFGNSEMPEILEDIQRVLQSQPQNRKRQLAIEALRMVDDPRARSLLSDLTTSADGEDQVTAVEALKLQPFIPEILERAMSYLSGDSPSQPRLRKAYIDWLFLHRIQINHLDQKLRGILETESNEDNRRLILSYLTVVEK